MAQFILEWSDFSGGYYVGKSDVGQPDNTWRGVDVQVSPVDGTLVRTAGYFQEEASDIAYSVPGAYHSAHPFPSEPVSCESTTRYIYAWWAVYDAAGVKEPRLHIYSVGAGVTTVDLGDQIPQSNPIVVQYGAVPHIYVATSNGTTHQIARVNATTAALVTTTVTEPLAVLARWGDFMAGASLTTNKMWFSSDFATKFITWNALDFFLVGDEDQIAALVVVRDQLYVGKSGGWWVFTGILDDFSSVAIRPLLEGYGPYAPPFSSTRDATKSNAACSSEFGVLYPRDSSSRASARAPVPDSSGRGFHALQGIQSKPVNHVKLAEGPAINTPLLPVDGSSALASADFFDSSGITYPSDPNLGSAWTGISWVLLNRQWTVLTLPIWGSASGFAGSWCRDFRVLGIAYPNYGFFLATKSTGATTRALRVYGHPLHNDFPDSFTEVKVTLSSRMRVKPFRVRQAYVEAVYSAREHPITGASLTGTGSVSLLVQVDGISNADGSVSTASAATFPVTTGSDDVPPSKKVLRLAPSDGAIGYEVTPVVTFAGCKIRRVVLVCEEEVWP